jgi:hypothetical protein
MLDGTGSVRVQLRPAFIIGGILDIPPTAVLDTATLVLDACTEHVMSFDLTPNTLNLRSMGHWVTGTLEPEPPASPADIDVAAILLNGSVRVDASAPTSIGDVDADGRPDLTVKFDRTAVLLVVPEGEAVPVTVTGEIGSGCFEATNVIRVRHGHVSAPTAGSVLQEGSTSEVRPLLGVAGASLGFALHGVVPNPGRGLNVSFSLINADPATLSVFDVSGRGVAVREVGSLGAGRHVVSVAASETLAPGVYLVHLLQGSRQLIARAVVIQ